MTDARPRDAARTLRLLIVDDHEVVRQGLVALLDRREGFQVVAEAGTVAEAVEQARKFEPDIVVMDVRLPDGSGIEACREIRAELPATRVVMLTSYPDEEAVLSAIVAGAAGYLLKQIRARDLVAALEAVGRGESLLDPAVTEKVLERVRRIATGGQTDELAMLTSQEQKILMLVAEGKTNKEIAADVFLSDKTVKNYVSSILSKLNLERRAQAAAFVAKHRIGARARTDRAPRSRSGRNRAARSLGPTGTCRARHSSSLASFQRRHRDMEQLPQSIGTHLGRRSATRSWRTAPDGEATAHQSRPHRESGAVLPAAGRARDRRNATGCSSWVPTTPKLAFEREYVVALPKARIDSSEVPGDAMPGTRPARCRGCDGSTRQRPDVRRSLERLA